MAPGVNVSIVGSAELYAVAILASLLGAAVAPRKTKYLEETGGL
jgi:hypothetical protein